MEFIIALALCYFCSKSKDKESGSASSSETEINVHCPYCKESCYIGGKGNWNCPHCQNMFIYDNLGRVFREDETITEQTTLLIKLFAKIAKADGVVTVNEINVVDSIVNDILECNEKQKRMIRDIFNEAKSDGRDYKLVAGSLHELLRGDENALVLVVQCLKDIAAADSPIHSEQHNMINFISNMFGLNRGNSYSHESSNGGRNYKSNGADELDKYYKVLECSKENTDEQIKGAYRRLMKKYHPDIFMSKDLPEDMLEYAKIKSQEIQEAYEKIQKVRKIS